MWEDLTTGLCVLGFTAAITVLLIELPAVLDLPSIVRRRAISWTRTAAFGRGHIGRGHRGGQRSKL
jgi:hypothetical protein